MQIWIKNVCKKNEIKLDFVKRRFKPWNISC